MDRSSAAESCPRCLEVGKVSHLTFVYYNRAEAFSTCKDKNCIYFVTDTQGNPVKFRFNTELKRLLPISPVKRDIKSEIEELMSSLQSECMSDKSISLADISESSLSLNNTSTINTNVDSYASGNYYDVDVDSFLNEIVMS